MVSTSWTCHHLASFPQDSRGGISRGFAQALEGWAKFDMRSLKKRKQWKDVEINTVYSDVTQDCWTAMRQNSFCMDATFDAIHRGFKANLSPIWFVLPEMLMLKILKKIKREP